MADHYRLAEHLMEPQPKIERFVAVTPEGERRAARVPMIPADPVTAQIHATLAVADQLTRIADALERLAGQQSPGSR